MKTAFYVFKEHLMYEKFKKPAFLALDGFIFLLNLFMFLVLYNAFSPGWEDIFRGHLRVRVFKDSAPIWSFILLFFFSFFLFSFSFFKTCIAYRRKQRKAFILWGIFPFVFYSLSIYHLIYFIVSLR